jgi:hypothetical protein
MQILLFERETCQPVKQKPQPCYFKRETESKNLNHVYYSERDSVQKSDSLFIAIFFFCFTSRYPRTSTSLSWRGGNRLTRHFSHSSGCVYKYFWSIKLVIWTFVVFNFNHRENHTFASGKHNREWFEQSRIINHQKYVSGHKYGIFNKKIKF